MSTNQEKDLKQICKNCVNFLDPALPSKPKCELTGFMQGYTDYCKAFQFPVPYEDIEVGDLVEYWWCGKVVKGLVLDKDEVGHLSLGEEKQPLQHRLNIPNSVWKRRITRIILKQAIDGATFKRYGV